LNQSHNTGGIGASNQEVFSQRGSGLVQEKRGPVWPAEIASTLNAAFGSKLGLEDQHINSGAPLFVQSAVPILEAGARTGKSTTDKRAGMGVGEDGDPMYTLQAGKQHAVAFAQNTRDEVRLMSGDGQIVGALAASPGMKQTCYVAQAVTGDISHTLNTANNGKGSSEDGTGRGTPIIAFSAKDYGGDAQENLSPTLRAGGHSGSHANAGVMPAVAHTVALRGRAGGATAELGGEVATALRASSGGGDKPHVLAVHGTQDPCVGVEVTFAQGRNNGGENAVLVEGYTPEIAPCLRSGNMYNNSDPMMEAQMFVAPQLAVRRLTPGECEKLQGFLPEHTLVPYRNKPAADGPRYKSIGNSFAIPVVAWIGRRIARHLEKGK